VVSAALTSEEGAHMATVSIADLSNGYYGISYETTRSGWFAVQIQVDALSVVGGAFRVFVAAGVAEETQSFACFHENSGCYNLDRGSAVQSCSRLLQSVPTDTLRCSEANDASPALMNVRLVDRHGNEVSRPRWQDFIRCPFHNSCHDDHNALNICL